MYPKATGIFELYRKILIKVSTMGTFKYFETIEKIKMNLIDANVKLQS